MGTPGWHLPVSICCSLAPLRPPLGSAHTAGTYLHSMGQALYQVLALRCAFTVTLGVGMRPLSHGHGNILNEDRASPGGSFIPDRGYRGENWGSLCWPIRQWCEWSLCVLPSFWSALEEPQNVEGGGKASRGQEAGAPQRHLGSLQGGRWEDGKRRWETGSSPSWPVGILSLVK